MKAHETSVDLALDRTFSSSPCGGFTPVASAYKTTSSTFSSSSYILSRCVYMNSMEAAINMERIHDRSCQAKPDIGSAEYVARLFWWRDYAVLSNDHGLLHSIRKSAGHARFR